eukprot:sb/3467871/
MCVVTETTETDGRVPVTGTPGRVGGVGGAATTTPYNSKPSNVKVEAIQRNMADYNDAMDRAIEQLDSIKLDNNTPPNNATTTRMERTSVSSSSLSEEERSNTVTGSPPVFHVPPPPSSNPPSSRGGGNGGVKKSKSSGDVLRQLLLSRPAADQQPSNKANKAYINHPLPSCGSVSCSENGSGQCSDRHASSAPAKPARTGGGGTTRQRIAARRLRSRSRVVAEDIASAVRSNAARVNANIGGLIKSKSSGNIMKAIRGGKQQQTTEQTGVCECVIECECE